jgi:hypothetical protein
MHSLKTKSCLTLLKSKSLREIIEFFGDDENASVRDACDTPEFWRSVINKFYDDLLDRRRDIDDRDLALMALDLSRNVETVYGITTNLDVSPELKLQNPTIVKSLKDESLRANNIEMQTNCAIEGLRPLPGTVGFFGEYTLREHSYDSANNSYITIYFLMRPDGDWDALELAFKTYLANIAFDLLFVTASAGDLFFISTAPGVFQNFPFKGNKYGFINRFIDLPIDKDPSHLSELYTHLESDHDTHFQVWVARVEF